MESAEQMIERLIAEVKNKVYAACVNAYEDAERAGIIVGNGHHMAGEVASEAGALLRARYEKMEGAGGSEFAERMAEGE